MSLDGEPQLLRRHAAAVIDDRDEAAPAFLEGHRDALGGGIDGVLDQLLHRAGRPLDHLAGGDLVDQGGRKTAQRAHGAQSTTSAFGKDTGSESSYSCFSASGGVGLSGLPTTTVVIASSRSTRRATRR